jgi:hypothetical protein
MQRVRFVGRSMRTRTTEITHHPCVVRAGSNLSDLHETNATQSRFNSIEKVPSLWLSRREEAKPEESTSGP